MTWAWHHTSPHQAVLHVGDREVGSAYDGSYFVRGHNYGQATPATLAAAKVVVEAADPNTEERLVQP